MDNQSFVNDAAVLNLANCDGMDDLVARVRALDADAEQMNAMGSLPVLQREPALLEVRERLGGLMRAKGLL